MGGRTRSTGDVASIVVQRASEVRANIVVDGVDGVGDEAVQE